jgi:hypothetical protein
MPRKADTYRPARKEVSGVRAALVATILALVLAVLGAASAPSAAADNTAASTSTPTGALGVCTPAWGNPAIPVICV